MVCAAGVAGVEDAGGVFDVVVVVVAVDATAARGVMDVLPWPLVDAVPLWVAVCMLARLMLACAGAAVARAGVATVCAPPVMFGCGPNRALISGVDISSTRTLPNGVWARTLPEFWLGAGAAALGTGKD